jgi:hypothetical protein
MELLVARAGLALNPGQMGDLVLAWRQLSTLIASIPRKDALADDQAYVFRLPPPGTLPEPARPASAPAPKARGAKAGAAKAGAAKPGAAKSGAAKRAKMKKVEGAKRSAAKKPAKPVRRR